MYPNICILQTHNPNKINTMKTKVSLIATAATMALFSSASGQTVIDITGSTAGRSAVHAAILTTLTGEVFSWSGNASVTSANRAIYTGTVGGNAVIVRTFWSGSAAGVRDVSNSVQLAASYIDKATVPNGAQIASPVLAPASAETISEIGFSDVFQSSTSFTTNLLVAEDEVAVLPFRFLANDGAPAGLTNVTPGQFRALFTGLGEAPLSLFTGLTGDKTHTIYATGRNDESGTRITAQAETGTGVFATLAQYTGTGDPAALTFVGNGGYSSGGNVATLLSAATAAGTSLIGYVGVSDGATALTGGAKALSYNGVPYTDSAVRNGSYSFWSYLHQFRMTLTGTSLTFYNNLASNLTAAPGSGTVNLALMNVERSADGATVTPK
jgi:hypothetical protein